MNSWSSRTISLSMKVLLLSCLLIWVQPFQATYAETAKGRYLSADTCLKKLKRSAVKKNKVSAWLNCIDKYKSIHNDFPGDAWAPAGLYKAAELSFQLARRTGSPVWARQADDLLERVRRSYPQSAYSARAKTLATANTSLPREENPSFKIKKSQKTRTRNDKAIAEYQLQKLMDANAAAGKELSRPETDPDPEPKPNDSNYCGSGTPAPSDSESAPVVLKGDATVTDLRFWSNPEYTRVVVNANSERKYTHRLLKKDPALNVQFQRLYVDIDQARLGPNIPDHTPINDDLLKQARAGQFAPHTVRVVVDINSFESYKIFSLKDPFRIVIDLWGKDGKAAPMDEMQTALEKAPAPGVPPEKQDRVTTDNLKSSDIARQLALGVRKIVIDPGHGGKDPGAPGYVKGIWEKDIVLKLSLNLAEKLRKRLNCEVMLTRTTDRKLTLEERTAIANTKRADLFISMHCNAAKNKKLSGIETYILNLTTDEQAIAVAARENATSEKNISDLAYILNDLMKHAKIEESTRLANDVQKSMVLGMNKKYKKIRDLGVKQAPFYVLLGARMPAILIESSFISNKTECKRLMTKSYQDDICNAIANGIEKYINATNPKHI